MNEKLLKSIAEKLRALGEEVKKNLGCDFEEHIYQSAMAIEFRRNKIDYLKEVNIEIFYKGESVGVDRPDFIITKIGDCSKPIILELKVSDKITDDHRAQLKSYYVSLPKNNNPVLTDFIGGILMAFTSYETESKYKVKLFVVDEKFNVIIDDQVDEDKQIALERERKKDLKKEEKEQMKKVK
jgi:GxxExxY protein